MYLINISDCLLIQPTRSVADYNVIDFGIMAELFGETVSCFLYEFVVKIGYDQIDGASAESSDHDPGPRYAMFACTLVKEVEFLAADFV